MTKHTGFDVAFRSTTLEAASQMDLSPIYSGTTTTKGFALLFDAILTTDYVALVSLPGGYKYKKLKGTGVRVAMKMTQLTADVRLNFAAVAAQTKLNLANTAYKVQGIGLNNEVIASFLEVPLDGELDDKTFGAIRRALADKLPEYLEGQTVGIGDYSVPVPAYADVPESRARAVCWAVSRVAQKKSLKKAIATRPGDVSPEAIIVVYSQFTSSADPLSDTPPTDVEATNAGRWLANGASPA